MTTHSSTFNFSQETPLACETPAVAAFEPKAEPAETVRPNTLVRWSFYLSLFAIPYSHLYLPGTGERVGVTRIVQLLMLGSVLSQPRVCLRWVPRALFWFFGYIGLRIVWGFWLTPDQFNSWWPNSREFLEFLPWVWVMFNVLQFPETREGGLWALGFGCSLCALFHIAGIGVAETHDGLETRSAVFGMNPNEEGASYGTAVIALLGLWMLRPPTWSQRFLPFPLITVISVAMAKTGSRTPFLVVGIGVLVLFLLGKAADSRARRLCRLLALGAMLAVILWQVPTIMQRFGDINPQNIGQHNPRARMAPVLWEMFLRSPVWGLGPDSYEWELTRRAMPYLINQGKLIVSHNLALLLLVETGIIGFLIFSAGVATSLGAAWRARFKPCGPLPLALLLPLAIGGATVCNPSHHFVFWVALAYALA
ncbi:MAG TPA: O-antigen ligase family protein [Verrucomicrobiae bacterium]|nr:O-antigen ligase family protein [Verrucomicrobiae bacterium]